MSLWQMSAGGAVLIGVVLALRAAALSRLSKNTFLALWWVVLFRLLVPFSLAAPLSGFGAVGPLASPSPAALGGMPAGTPTLAPQGAALPGGAAPSALRGFLSVWPFLWGAGALACLLFFALAYRRARARFRASLPFCDPRAQAWLARQGIRRPVRLRQSDEIDAPLTFGLWRPVILLPSALSWRDDGQLRQVLLHECIHIRRWDALTKRAAVLALCLHWFNPLVWVMLPFLNRDIELACDESVVRRLGEPQRAAYARTLIELEEKRSGLLPLDSGFGGPVMEERITAIMKHKKCSRALSLAALVLVCAVAVVFAAPAAGGLSEGGEERETGFFNCPGFSDEEAQALMALQWAGYEDMTVAAYQQRVWELTDTPAYRALLERFSQQAGQCPAAQDEGFTALYQNTIEPLTAEAWQTRSFGGYTVTEFPGASDNAVLEYILRLTIRDRQALTVGRYSAARRGMADGLEALLRGCTGEQLRDEARMQAVIDTAIKDLTAQWGAEALDISVEYHYTPLSGPDGGGPAAGQTEELEERRQYPNATQEDYQTLLALKTQDFQDRTVADFNMALLRWADADYDRMEQVGLDIGYRDFAVSLSREELAFLTLTVQFSSLENGKYVQSSYTGRPEQDPVYALTLPQRTVETGGESAWCDLYCQFSYHIADKNTLTVGERDSRLSRLLADIERFWSETDLETLLNMTEDEVAQQLQALAARNSDSDMTFAVQRDAVGFEAMDERAYRR